MLNSLSKLETSSAFKDWKENNQDSYLCSCFFMDKENWQFDYYLPKEDKIKSFIVSEEIEELKDAEIFKKDKRKLDLLDLKKVKINVNEVLEIANELIKKKHDHEKIIKRIIILQNLEEETWNITYVTSSFNVVNFKISAISGKVLAEKIENIMSFKAS
tara:strand:- start:12423 stop:12899 length:477 start_codon:yes stop_codon:yes gene_type:complete